MLPFSQIVKIVDGIETEVLVQTYADRILILITQLGKVGNLVNISQQDTTSSFS